MILVYLFFVVLSQKSFFANKKMKKKIKNELSVLTQNFYHIFCFDSEKSQSENRAPKF